MITAVVTFQLPDGFTQEKYAAMAEQVSGRFRDMPGLIRKNFIYGEGGTAGGIYTWQSQSDADALYTDAWQEKMKESFGSVPDVRYFETAVIVDNEAGDVKVAA